MDVNKISGTDPFLQNLQFVILMDDVIGDTNENGMWHTSFGHIFFFFFFFSLSFFFLSRFFSSGMILQAVPYEVNITISIHSFIQTHSHHFSSISKFEARGNEFEKKREGRDLQGLWLFHNNQVQYYTPAIEREIVFRRA